MSSKRPAVVVGMGELGSVFATGLLKLGHPVFPVLRGQSPADVVQGDAPEVVMIAVGENDLDSVLAARPGPASDLVLMQNELLPRAWERHDLVDPNVVVVWFEKKTGRAVHTVLPSVVCGPRAALLAACLEQVNVSFRCVAREHLLFELVKKNLYILVHNICGLRVPGTVRELWEEHGDLAHEVASEVLDLQAALTGSVLDRDRLLVELGEAVEADPDHGCAGRTARERLRRALSRGSEYALSLPRLNAIEQGLTRG